MIIRRERTEDYEAILNLTYRAFLHLDYPGRQRMDEHFLVSLLRGSDMVIPELCLVAECDGEISGHILYSQSQVRGGDGRLIPTITFGPLSVLPEYHRQGVGSGLVRDSMEKARELGYGAVLITGVPDYYPRLGFKRAREYGLALPGGGVPDAFMAYELIPGWLDGGGEFQLLAPEFEMAEQDDLGYEQFHKAFMRRNYPGRLMFRPLWDADVGLMEKWLHRPHVAPWYEDPDDWMREIRGRRDEFSFIKSFIAEIDGVPVGFGQYYDCYWGQQLETWYTVDKPGVMFSMDYLIGEQEYLTKGHGREMVRLLEDMLIRLGAERVIVQADRDNAASCSALEANGYTYNGECYAKNIT
ncbi:MAG: GNAT family N-acetyltransferase [Syntrophomonadaceae bacterium]|nr:GNAT family N-acetyltransferase [Syntrophomonadaceae bacterium]